MSVSGSFVSNEQLSVSRRHADNADWLEPWRTPADALNGGMGLYLSLKNTLQNVVKARRVSVQHIYGLRHDPQTATLMTSMRSLDAQQQRSSTGLTLKDIACRLSARRPSTPGAGDSGVMNSSMGSIPSPHNFGLRSQPSISVPPSNSRPQSPSTSSPAALPPPLPTHVALPVPQQHHNASAGNSASPPVPSIPRFGQLVEEKEALMKHIERERGSQPAHSRQRPQHSASPQSPPRQGSEDPVAHDHTARPGRRSFSAQGLPANTPGEDDAWSSDGDAPRPATSPSPPHPAEEAEEAPEGEYVDSDYDEFEDGNASEQNFGEGGHLACVPGDSLHNRYTLIKQLGVGRSSRVWLAVDLEQCSITRRQLIRELGEAKVRRMYNPKEKPLFVAIKVFRCGDTYSDCALYEANILKYINEYIRVKSIQKRFTLSHSQTNSAANSPSRGTMAITSANSSLPNSPPRPSAVELGASYTAAGSSTTDRLEAVLANGDNVTCMKNYFTIDGDYGTHYCLVMDVVGAGVDAAINETRLEGLPAPVVRSILGSALNGLAMLASFNVIHTDIKPENLLFVDLQEDVAAEMQTFQTEHLHLRPDSPLWGPSAHRRVSVAEYAKHHHRVGSSTVPRLRSADARQLYRVHVSDFGLSFVVPPPLRGGVEMLRALGGDTLLELDPEEQLQLLAQERARQQPAGRSPPPTAARGAAAAATSALSCDASSPPFHPLTAAPTFGSNSAVHVDRIPVLSVTGSNTSNGDDTPHHHHAHREIFSSANSVDRDGVEDARFSQCEVTYGMGSPLVNAIAKDTSPPSPDDAHHLEEQRDSQLLVSRLQGSTLSGPRLTSLFSCVVVPPTSMEIDILRRQNYRRGITVQSREYRAPEVLLGQHFLPSCDVWSIGCMAYELVTGKFLFDISSEYGKALTEANEAAAAERRAQRAQDTDNNSSSQFSKWMGKIGNFATSSTASLSLSHSKHEPTHDDRPSSPEPLSVDEEEEDGTEAVNALYYEEIEKDMDVVHLKAIMRLLGPPPPLYLMSDPVGVYVEHFFGPAGDFLFWEDGEEEQCGVGEAALFSHSGHHCPSGAAAGSTPTYDTVSAAHASGWVASYDKDKDKGEPKDSNTVSALTTPSTVALGLNGTLNGTRNYPVLTAAWRQVQEELRDKLGSAQEAADFETFLVHCLQWDPEQRLSAIQLLKQDWFARYPDVAVSGDDSD